MTPFKQWLDASVDDFPADGVAGVPTDWFDVGPLDLPGGRITVTDLWGCYPDPDMNVSADVPAGRYTVAARGMDFAGHRRVAGVRLTVFGSPAVNRGCRLGEVSVDSWGIVAGDVEAWQAGVDADVVNDFNGSHSGLYADGCELVTWTLAGRDGRFAIAFTGMGDGGYPVIEWVDAVGTRVGVEVDFFPPDDD